MESFTGQREEYAKLVWGCEVTSAGVGRFLGAEFQGGGAFGVAAHLGGTGLGEGRGA